MKNTLILILIFSMVLSGILPLGAYGQGVDEKILEDVILKLKGLFDISDDYDNFTSRVTSYDDNVTFYLNWSDSNEEFPNISIHTDSQGNIISFNKYENQPVESDSRLPKISKDEAFRIAMDFIEKIDPAVFNELELKESSHPISTWDRQYSFRFIRNINEVPYTANTVNLNVDMQTGQVASLNINWERKLEFPDTDNIISLEEAEKAYKEEIGLKLVYKRGGRNIIMDNENNDSEYFLAYTNIGGLKGIDAKTGKSINISFYSTFYNNEEATTESASDGGQPPIITPEEREEIDKLKGLLPIEEIEKEAREILDLDDSYELRSKSLYSSWEDTDEFFYSLNFVKIVEDKEYSSQISLNAKTLELTSFYKYRDIDTDSKVRINKSEAIELAKEFIGKINPDKLDQVELIETDTGKDNEVHYRLNFIRKVDQIYVESDSISIGIDAVNKDINSYNINWYKGDLPSSDNIISLDRAYEVLFNGIGLDLNYHNIYDYKNLDKEQNMQIKLVYGINQDKPMIIDGFTGDILDYSGNVYRDNTIPSYTDIDKSYAKDKIITLAQYGIAFSGDEFKPNDLISQEDFLYLLWKSINPYRGLLQQDMDEIYKDLIRQNIVKTDEKNRERPVTKEEAVKFTIRAMGYGKLAEIDNIYSDIFNDGDDIDPNLKGYMTLAYGLKIINGDGSDKIRPKYELERQDAASILYNYMFN